MLNPAPLSSRSLAALSLDGDTRPGGPLAVYDACRRHGTTAHGWRSVARGVKAAGFATLADECFDRAERLDAANPDDPYAVFGGADHDGPVRVYSAKTGPDPAVIVTLGDFAAGHPATRLRAIAALEVGEVYRYTAQCRGDIEVAITRLDDVVPAAEMAEAA